MSVIILSGLLVYLGAQVIHLSSQNLFFMETKKYYPLKEKYGTLSMYHTILYTVLNMSPDLKCHFNTELIATRTHFQFEYQGSPVFGSPL